VRVSGGAIFPAAHPPARRTCRSSSKSYRRHVAPGFGQHRLLMEAPPPDRLPGAGCSAARKLDIAVSGSGQRGAIPTHHQAPRRRSPQGGPQHRAESRGLRNHMIRRKNTITASGPASAAGAPPGRWTGPVLALHGLGQDLLAGTSGSWPMMAPFRSWLVSTHKRRELLRAPAVHCRLNQGAIPDHVQHLLGGAPSGSAAKNRVRAPRPG